MFHNEIIKAGSKVVLGNHNDQLTQQCVSLTSEVFPADVAKLIAGYAHTRLGVVDLLYEDHKFDLSDDIEIHSGQWIHGSEFIQLYVYKPERGSDYISLGDIIELLIRGRSESIEDAFLYIDSNCGAKKLMNELLDQLYNVD